MRFVILCVCHVMCGVMYMCVCVRVCMHNINFGSTQHMYTVLMAFFWVEILTSMSVQTNAKKFLHKYKGLFAICVVVIVVRRILWYYYYY